MSTYPQRWLIEHKAVTSEEGWRRPTTNELLKNQKGLAVGALPKLTAVEITTTEESIPVTTSAFNLEFDYVITAPEYVPLYIKLVSQKSKNAVITYTVDVDTKKITASITGMVKNEVLSFTVESDAVTSNTISFTVVEQLQPET